MATIQKLKNRGRDTYRVLIRRKGYKALTETFKTKEAAIDWARKREAEIDLALPPNSDRDKECSVADFTFAEACDWYAHEYVHHLKARTQNTYKYRLALCRKAPFAEKAFLVVDQFDIVQWIDARRKQGRAEATINHDINTVSGIYTFAAEKWREYKDIPNPVALIKLDKPKLGKSRERRLQGDEYQRTCGELLKAGHKEAYHGFRLAIATGRRLNEITCLQWPDIELKVAIPLAIYRTKSNLKHEGICEERVEDVPLSPWAVSILKEIGPRKSGPVFSIKGTTISKQVRATYATLGIKNLTFHDLRHEALSRFSEIGDDGKGAKLDQHDLAKLSGHRDPRTLAKYIHKRTALVGQRIATVTPADR